MVFIARHKKGSVRGRGAPRLLAMATLAACVSMGTPRARGAILEWQPSGSPSALFNAPTSWNLGFGPVPGVLDTARFSLNNIYTATFTDSATTGTLQVVAGSVSFVASGGPRNYTVAGAATVSNSTLTLADALPQMQLQVGTLNVNAGGNVSVLGGNFLRTASGLNIGTSAAGTATMTVGGSGSMIDIFGVTLLGDNGGTAALTLQDGAQGLFDAIKITDTSSDAAGATMSVFSGASAIAFGDVGIGLSILTGQASALLINGTGSSFSQDGSAALSVGTFATSTSALLSVTGGGSYSSGTGDVFVGASGTLLIQSGGSFTSNGNFTVSGGSVVRSADALFTMAPGKSFTAGGEAQVNFAGVHTIGDGSTYQILSGADLNMGGYLDVGNGSDGTLIVDGSGSSITTSGSPFWGDNGGRATVTIRNHASVVINSPLWTSAGNGTSLGLVSVHSFASMTVGTLNIAASAPISSLGLLSISSSATVTQTDDSAMTIGSAAGGQGSLVIGPGTFTSGMGVTSINATGMILIAGGTYHANGPIEINGGTMFVRAGHLHLQAGSNFNGASLGDLGLGRLGSQDPAILTVHPGSVLTTTGLLVNSSGVLVLDGGLYNANYGLNLFEGTLQFKDGTLNLESELVFKSQYGNVNFAKGYGIERGQTFDFYRTNFTASQYLDVGYGSAGTLLLDQSALNIGFASFWGGGGGSGNVEIVASTVTIPAVTVGYGNTPDTFGRLAVKEGSTLLVGDFSIADEGASNLIGEVTIGGTVVQSNNANLVLGAIAAGSGSLTLNTDGIFTSGGGTGTVEIRKTGRLSINGGTFNAMGNVTVDGGAISVTSGTLNMGGLTLTARNNATVSFTQTHHIMAGEVIVESGASLSNVDVYSGALIIDGTGSIYHAPSLAVVGAEGGSATLVLRNGQITLNVNSLLVSAGTESGTDGQVRIESGAYYYSGGLVINPGGGTGSSGTVTVSDPHSTIDTFPDASTVVGGTGSGLATLSVLQGGKFISGTPGIVIHPNGNLNIVDGEVLTAGPLVNQGSITIAGTSGTLRGAQILNSGVLIFDRSNHLVLDQTLSNSSTGFLHQIGTGTTTISGNASINGTFRVSSGTLIFAPTDAAHPGTDIRLKVRFATVDSGATLDLTNNPLIVQLANIPIKMAELQYLNSLLQTGFNGGDWLGKRITSSTVAADQSATGSHLTGLAIYDNAVLNLTTFGGQAVDTMSVMIAPALIGDTNFDQVVNAVDFAVVTSNWQTSKTHWSAGDLNYDGFVDLLDAVIVATHLSPPGGPLLESPLTAVPEPSSVACLFPAAMLLRRSRKRRHE